MRNYGALAAVILVAAVVSVPARAQDDLASKVVNDPGEPQVNGAKASLRDDAKVQGGKALRIQVKGKGTNAWDAAIESPINKTIKAGDQVVLVFDARLEKGDTATAAFPFAGVQMARAPYSSVAQNGFELGPEWKTVEIRGKADRNYPAGSLKVSIHLATAKQVVDFGPIVVLDLGPGS